MSDFSMPIIEPAIDYTKVPPINQKRTIAFINRFISQTVTFLNKFALSCEEQLFEFENKLQRVEASLELLESRVYSISGLENENPIAQNSPQEEKESTETPKVDNETPNQEPDNDISPQETKPENDMQPITLDPTYGKFFKMLHFGVPKPAIKLKMDQEGLDSSLLDNPDKLVPKVTVPMEEESWTS